jgi:hypothetical protein
MPTAQEIGASGYERAGTVFRVISEMFAGIASQGSAYITSTLWEAVRSFYVGWKWGMDSLTDGFKAAAYDPAVSAAVSNTLGGVAANASAFYGTYGGTGGRSFLTDAGLDALRTPEAYRQATSEWATGASQLFQKVAEVYALFWSSAPT